MAAILIAPCDGIFLESLGQRPGGRTRFRDGSRLAASQVRRPHQITVIHAMSGLPSGASALAITSAGEHGPFAGVSSNCGATTFTRIPWGGAPA
jgi:hypothetical protein